MNYLFTSTKCNYDWKCNRQKTVSRAIEKDGECVEEERARGLRQCAKSPRSAPWTVWAMSSQHPLPRGTRAGGRELVSSPTGPHHSHLTPYPSLLYLNDAMRAHSNSLFSLSLSLALSPLYLSLYFSTPFSQRAVVETPVSSTPVVRRSRLGGLDRRGCSLARPDRYIESQKSS